MFKSLFFRKKKPKKFNFSPEAMEEGSRPVPTSASKSPAGAVPGKAEQKAREPEPVSSAKNRLVKKPKPARKGFLTRWSGRSDSAESEVTPGQPPSGQTSVGKGRFSSGGGSGKIRKPMSITVGPAALVIALVAFLLVGGWAAMATSAVVFGDPLSARLIAQQSDMQFAYEQKLLVFRSQLDRIAMQARSDRTDVEGRITDLMLRQASIEAKQQMLLQMAGAAGAADQGPQKRSDVPAPTKFAVLDKSTPPLERLDLVEKAVEGNEEIHNRLAEDLAAQSNLRMAALRNELSGLGVDINSFAPPRRPTGILLPKSLLEADSRFEAGLSQARRTYGDLGKLQQAANALPVARPVTPDFRQTSPFGNRVHPIFGYSRLHAGIDFGVPIGTPIYATGSGVVQSASVASGYGNLVIIDHGNGITSRYAHLSSFLVQTGQPVAMGMVIARSGNTGASTGPHLHYETRVNGEPNDPMRFLAIGSTRDLTPPRS